MQPLINLLADGHFHPGEELGEVLGISRAGVWKQIQKLQEAGLDVQSIRGKGYRLAYPLEWLQESDIRNALRDSAAPLVKQLEILSQTQSTNDVAMKMAATGVGSGYVCLAEQQTAGRGRRGRNWVSPLASNLYLSVVWEFYQGAAQLEGLSLATGVAVASALSNLNIDGVELKWPNDILVNYAKLGGILLEMTGDPAGRCQVVLGVGLNHRLPKHASDSIDQSWCRVEDLKPGISRNALAAQVISELVLMLRRFSLEGFAPFRERWQQLDCYEGKEAVVKTGAQDIAGIARGVDETGGLVLETATGKQILKGGELSLRLAQ